MMTEDEWQQFEKQKLAPWLWTSAEQAKLRAELIIHQGGVCALCAQPIDEARYALQSTLDHVIPKSRGGPDRIGNLVVAHRNCNSKKGSDAPTGCQLIFLLAVNNRLGVEPMRW